LYFADLLGAALGAILVTLLLNLLGGEAALLAAAIAPAIAAVCLPAHQEPSLSDTSSDVPAREPRRVGLLPRTIRLVAVAGVFLTGFAVVFGRQVWNISRRARNDEGFAQPNGREPGGSHCETDGILTRELTPSKESRRDMWRGFILTRTRGRVLRMGWPHR